MAILNSYILESNFDQRHQFIGRRKHDLFAFRMELVEGLIGGFRGKKCAGQPRLVSDNIKLKPEHHHLPEHSPVVHDCIAPTTNCLPFFSG